MPVRKVSVHYEFPTCEADRLAFKEYHAMSNRQWVSTAVVDGIERMQFARFEEYEVVTPPAIEWNDPKPTKAKLRKYPGQDSKGRAEWDR